MRGTDLIGCEVYDTDGIPLGRVHDLRFELTAGQGRPFRCELIGLDCSSSLAVGHRLGYGTGDMAGPWPLSSVFRRYHDRSVRSIPWREVADVHAGHIRLRCTKAALERGESA